MLRSLVVALLLAVGLSGQPDAPAYRQVGTIPAIVGGNPLVTFAFDPLAHRLYAGSRSGLFWLDTTDPQPDWHPTFKAAIGIIRFAPELRRVFFTTAEDVGFVDLDALDKPTMFVHTRASGLVYEPQRREVYLSYSRVAKVSVFNGRTAEPTGTIDVPGWEATLKEAIPGRVFLTLPDKQGLYVINANSHRIGPWPVEGAVVMPAAMEVDPQGRYIFLAYDRNVVAIDTTTATVVGRLTTINTGSIAYDPGANLLIVVGIPQPSPIRLKVYRVDNTGFTLVSTLDNPKSTNGGVVEPTHNGFIQHSDFSWLLWSAAAAR